MILESSVSRTKIALSAHLCHIRALRGPARRTWQSRLIGQRERRIFCITCSTSPITSFSNIEVHLMVSRIQAEPSSKKAISEPCRPPVVHIVSLLHRSRRFLDNKIRNGRFRGYPRLTRLMLRVPEMAVFRSFEELNLMNLLRLQAELAYLEEQLQQIREEDSKDAGVRRFYATSFNRMEEYSASGDNLQSEILAKIGVKLETYSTVLLTLVGQGLRLMLIQTMLSFKICASTKLSHPQLKNLRYCKNGCVCRTRGTTF